MGSAPSFAVLAREVGRDGYTGPWRIDRAFVDQGDALDWADYLREDGDTETRVAKAEQAADLMTNRAARPMNAELKTEAGSAIVSQAGSICVA